MLHKNCWLKRGLGYRWLVMTRGDVSCTSKRAFRVWCSVNGYTNAWEYGWLSSNAPFTGARINIPIIAMTANALPSDRDACLAVKVNDHIGKPIDIWVTAYRVALTYTAHEARHDHHCAASYSCSDSATGLDLPSVSLRLDNNRSLFTKLARFFYCWSTCNISAPRAVFIPKWLCECRTWAAYS